MNMTKFTNRALIQISVVFSNEAKLLALLQSVPFAVLFRFINFYSIWSEKFILRGYFLPDYHMKMFGVNVSIFVCG